MICSLLGSIIYNFDIPLNLGSLGGILCLGYSFDQYFTNCGEHFRPIK